MRRLPVLNPGPRVHLPVGPGEVRPRIAMVTLGCDKNTVDSERILAHLAASGAEVARGGGPSDVVVVNTCGFIDVAKEESIDAILEATRLKASGGTRAVVAVGCLVQRYKEELSAELPEVDLFLGLTETDRLVPELRARGLLRETTPLMERPLRVLATETRHSSYLKVSEGCDHTCAFCAIPLMRGKHRSVPMERLVREAVELEARGVVELNLISQDTTWYGRDLVRNGRGAAGTGESGEFYVGRPFDGMAGLDSRAGEDARAEGVGVGEDAGGGDGRRRVDGAAVGMDLRRVSETGGRERGRQPGLLPDLLRALLAETGIPWFRLFYMYPSGIYPELVALLAAEPRIVPYLDMPIQHGSDRVLTLMRRPERRASILERVARLRSAIPDLVLRTTVIVGFPGETDADFEALLDLLETVRFDRLGAFAYSEEEGTRAAAMPDPVPESERRERLERVLELQRVIALERNESAMGRRVTVLVDRVGEGGVVGRTAGQAPEVDGETVLKDGPGGPVNRLVAGEFVRARIVDANEDDWIAELEAS